MFLIMVKFGIYIDESGTANPLNWKSSTYFTLCGLVTNNKNKEKLNTDLGNLKLKYFGKRSYILHGVNLEDHLGTSQKISNFANDLKIFLNNSTFFLLYVSVNKEKAFKRSWKQKTILKRSYRKLIDNLIKFLIAKNSYGTICAEASNIEQDKYLYEAFFHFIVNGISRNSITAAEVKTRLTSLSFVTKNNNDAEEQLADLFGYYGLVHQEIKKGTMLESDLSPVQRVLYDQMKKRFFRDLSLSKERKGELYKQIIAFETLP